MAEDGRNMKVARLNHAGLKTFAGYMESLKHGAAHQVPTGLLTSPENTELLSVNLEVELRDFASRFDAAEYLHQRFTAVGLADAERDAGMWAWLSLFYFDSVCPAGPGGVRKPGASARHIPEVDNFQRYYRHLLAGPYRIYRAHRSDPARALALLCQPLDSPGDMVEQFASRQELVTNPGVIGLATKLYVDMTSRRQKRGAGSKGGGSARRLWEVLDQFDLTWDLYAASTDELASVMPKEFSRFLKC